MNCMPLLGSSFGWVFFPGWLFFPPCPGASVFLWMSFLNELSWKFANAPESRMRDISSRHKIKAVFTGYVATTRRPDRESVIDGRSDGRINALPALQAANAFHRAKAELIYSDLLTARKICVDDFGCLVDAFVGYP